MKSLILQGVTKTFQRGIDRVAGLVDINFELEQGEVMGLIGTNGAGKSTLLNAITGQLKLDQGQLYLGNQPISQLNAKQRAFYIARVFQDPRMGTAPRMTVFENLMLAQRRGEKLSLKRSLTEDNRQNMKQLLAKFHLDLENRLDLPIEALSGGQRQIITLLMATLKQPQLLLLDEHTAALDPRTAKQVMGMTQQIIKDNQLTTLMVTHQLSDALFYCDRIMMMHQGQIKHIFSQNEIKKLTPATLYQALEALLNEDV